MLIICQNRNMLHILDEVDCIIKINFTHFILLFSLNAANRNFNIACGSPLISIGQQTNYSDTLWERKGETCYAILPGSWPPPHLLRPPASWQ